jgi:hypothetical protein
MEECEGGKYTALLADSVTVNRHKMKCDDA